jgi:GTPase SAR1 family protein
MTEKIRIALVGDSGAGKTIFCRLLETGVFSELVCASLGTEFYTYKVKNTQIFLYDLACNTTILRFTEPYIKRADAVLIFQDATKQNQEEDWVRFVKKNNPNAKLFHVRVKVDCRQPLYSAKSRGCISLGDLALSQKPQLDAFFTMLLEKFRSRSRNSSWFSILWSPW